MWMSFVDEINADLTNRSTGSSSVPSVMNLQTVFDSEPSFLRSSVSVRSYSSSSVSLPNLAFLERYRVAVPTVIVDLASSDDEKQLPSDFHPTEFDIICGRGRGHYNKPGCKRLREIIRRFIPDYLAAKNKFDKSAVISRILDAVKSQNSNAARFVKCKKGTWYEIGDDQAREKVGHTMRETIALLNSKQQRDEPNKMQTVVPSRSDEGSHPNLASFPFVLLDHEAATPTTQTFEFDGNTNMSSTLEIKAELLLEV